MRAGRKMLTSLSIGATKTPLPKPTILEWRIQFYFALVSVPARQTRPCRTVLRPRACFAVDCRSTGESSGPMSGVAVPAPGSPPSGMVPCPAKARSTPSMPLPRRWTRRDIPLMAYVDSGTRQPCFGFAQNRGGPVRFERIFFSRLLTYPVVSGRINVGNRRSVSPVFCCPAAALCLCSGS